MKLHIRQKGQGKPLVLVHGWAMNAAIWSHFSDQLSQHYQLTIIELPGHGKSDYGENIHALDDWANACLNVAPEQAIWLGWSLGGLIAQHIAIHYPTRINRLICMTSTPCFSQTKEWLSAMPNHTLKQFSIALKHNHQQTLERFLTLQVIGQKHTKALLKQLKKRLFSRPEPNIKALTQGLYFLEKIDLTAQISTIQCPQLWIFGGKDKLVPQPADTALQAINPHAQTLLIDKASHIPFLTHTELCLQAICHEC